VKKSQELSATPQTAPQLPYEPQPRRQEKIPGKKVAFTPTGIGSSKQTLLPGKDQRRKRRVGNLKGGKSSEKNTLRIDATDQRKKFGRGRRSLFLRKTHALGPTEISHENQDRRKKNERKTVQQRETVPLICFPPGRRDDLVSGGPARARLGKKKGGGRGEENRSLRVGVKKKSRLWLWGGSLQGGSPPREGTTRENIEGGRNPASSSSACGSHVQAQPCEEVSGGQLRGEPEHREAGLHPVWAKRQTSPTLSSFDRDHSE